MKNYLTSAINTIYDQHDNFIVIGLTGRTGSGCSTVAKILQTNKTDIGHSLFSGSSPSSAEERKQKIIRKHFEATWEPFLLIQARSVITTFLLDQDQQDLSSIFEDILGKDADKLEKLNMLLGQLLEQYKLLEAPEVFADAVNYYTKFLPEKCEEIRVALGESAFVRIYQKIGANIRLSGNPCSDEQVAGSFLRIAERINQIIKHITEKRRKDGKKSFIVIDAIRNPHEALYFQDRYSSFYLMAVSAPEADRRWRLSEQRFSVDDINRIDDQEYKSRNLKDIESYAAQDIQACLQRADLYVSNPNEKHFVDKFKNLSNQVIRFVSLIRRPGIITPTAIERGMQVAFTAKLNSGCISRQVGAAVTDERYSIKSIGWNDTPQGQLPCNLRSRDELVNGMGVSAYSDFEKTDEEYLAAFVKRSAPFLRIQNAGRSISFCFKTEYNDYKNDKNQVHTRSLHAEENAFLQLAKYGSSGIEGGNLFTTASPCALCSKKAYQLGIKNIYYIDPYPDIAISHVLRGGVNNPNLVLFSGAIGKAFHKLYSPIVAYKDELNALAQDLEESLDTEKPL